MEKEQNDDENPVKSSLDMYIYEYSQISKELQNRQDFKFLQIEWFYKIVFAYINTCTKCTGIWFCLRISW